MIFALSLFAIVILSAIFVKRFLNKLGIPMLFFFLCLGLFLGQNSLFQINYSDYGQTKDLASLALAFIIFYGGFCVRWESVKPVLLPAIVLSTLGVIFTAFIVGVFCHFFLNLPFLESFLIGAIISSTDAASVFSILQSKKLYLKQNTSPLLELESGSNDPMSYVLVILVLTLMQGCGADFVFILFLKQILLGILFGVVIAKIGIYLFQKTKLIFDGNDSLFVIALVLLTYVLPQTYNGNPFLAVYFLGIILGNADIDNKLSMINFFDSITKLAQIGIFFTLGILVSVDKLPEIMSSGVIIFLFLTFIARPVVIFSIMQFFSSSFEQKVILSWAGLRGVASIVFAIIAMYSGVRLEYDLYHLVFLISILSVVFQGSFLPLFASKFNMIDENVDIRKTFHDYHEECAIKFMRLTVPAQHQWIGKKISGIKFPNSSLVLYIKRDGKRILPKDSTKIKEGDRITLALPLEDL